jgi:hypothetical protein
MPGFGIRSRWTRSRFSTIHPVAVLAARHLFASRTAPITLPTAITVNRRPAGISNPAKAHENHNRPTSDRQPAILAG